MKPNILLVGDYNRKDFLFIASKLNPHFNLYFLEFAHKSEILSDEYSNWGKAIFWSEYKNAFDLIKKINPQKVLFYLIESFNHVALNVVCKTEGIKTYHIEHGIRNFNPHFQNLTKKIYRKDILSRLQELKKAKNKIRNRLFFINTVKLLPSEESLFLKDYFKVRKSNSIAKTFQLIKSHYRIADCYISFSPKIFSFHIQNDHLPKSYPVRYIGCPTFDDLIDISNKIPGNNILFIDQPFEVQHLFGWDLESKINFLEELVDFAAKQNKKLWIKPHPLTHMEVYTGLKQSSKVLFVKDENVFKKAIIDSNTILGFYSTLLMPLMAMKHTVCFSLNMHPSSNDKGVSHFLVDTGAIKQVNSWEELVEDFASADWIYQKQKFFKQKFIKDWLYIFDGKSTERLLNILLNDNF